MPQEQGKPRGSKTIHLTTVGIYRTLRGDMVVVTKWESMARVHGKTFSSRPCILVTVSGTAQSRRKPGLLCGLISMKEASI